MKAVMISIRPEWCEKIASGEKTVEVRKTKPKLEMPFKVYIYCTIGDGAKGDILPQSRVTCGKVIGEFVCDDITKILNFITHFGAEGRSEWELNTIARCSCLDYIAMLGYLGTDKDGYAWHISDLVIYDHPKELSEFRSYDARICIDENGYPMPTHAITRPPQSWCYVEGCE